MREVDFMENIIVILILAVIIGAVIFYLVRAKKKGRKCVGCPYAKQCGKCGGCAEIHTETQASNN